MQLPALLISDLHLTANPRDAYRWKVFDFVEEQLPVEGIKTLCILGDLTDAKDYHPASLVNEIVTRLSALSAKGLRIVILMGNHDYLKEGHAFFSFLSSIPGVTFVNQIWDDMLEGEGPGVLWLPHTKTPTKDWGGLDIGHFDFVFMHQTITGSVSSNGMKMVGEALPPWPKGVRVYSGDIHVPQVIGGVEYVGSPYPVHFGDSFDARAILIDKRLRAVDLRFDTLRRLALTVRGLRELKKFEFRRGDHVKLRIQLSPADKHEWSRIRREALEHLAAEGVEVWGIELRVESMPRDLGHAHEEATDITPAAWDTLAQFVKRNELGGDALDIGLDIVE